MDTALLFSLIGSIPGIALGALLGDPIKWAASALLHSAANRGIRRVADPWDTSYWYEDESGKRVERKDRVVLRQFGSYLRGHNEGRTDHRYTFSGRLRDQGVFTGTWKSVRGDTTYHGAFQLEVSLDGARMKGKWIGIDDDEEGMKHGEWIWNRKPRSE